MDSPGYTMDNEDLSFDLNQALRNADFSDNAIPAYDPALAQPEMHPHNHDTRLSQTGLHPDDPIHVSDDDTSPSQLLHFYLVIHNSFSFRTFLAPIVSSIPTLINRPTSVQPSTPASRSLNTNPTSR
jgi:hypothetical protein